MTGDVALVYAAIVVTTTTIFAVFFPSGRDPFSDGKQHEPLAVILDGLRVPSAQ